MDGYQFTVTPKAIEQIKLQLSKSITPNASLRLGVKSGGCSGFSYVLLFDDKDSKSRDIVFNVDGVKILIDNKSIVYLNGCTLDWEKTLLNQGFKFINPKVKSKCGCGTSFQV